MTTINKKSVAIFLSVCIVLLMGCAAEPVESNQIDTAMQEETDSNNNSFNAYLYSTGSLNEVVSVDSFGFSVSKYTNNADRRLETGEFFPIAVKLGAENYQSFVEWIDSKVVTYLYEDLYNLVNAYAKIEPFQNQITKQAYLHTELITDVEQLPTVQQIQNTLEKNSEEYLRIHAGYYSLDFYYTNLIAEILVNMLTDYYSELSQTDLSRIYCVLNDVKAVGIDSTDFGVNDLKQIYNARVTDEAVAMLDTEMMKQLRGTQTVERTIAHEVAHFFQRMCPKHRIIGLTQIGNSRYVEDFDNTGEVNSLHFQWLYEAAAEQMSMNEYDVKTPLIYTNMVGYLHTLNLITLLRPDYDENSIAVSQMSTEADMIYEVFGATTDAEKKEIASMLYSICYIQTEREDFSEVYKEKYGEIDGQQITIKKLMKESVAQTMTKYFYKNLAERVRNANVALQDIFYLINTFEAALNRHVVYDDAERYEYNDESMAFYVETQEKFFEIMAEDSGIALEEVVEKFDHFALIIKTDAGYERNCQFDWLTQAEKEYVGTVLTTNIENLTVNIRHMDY